MVKLRFIVRTGVLVLRISEQKTRFYKRVGYLLKGNPNIEKHWVASKERFSAYAINYMENNKILEDFKEIYWKLIQQHPELSAKQVAEFYKAAPKEVSSDCPVSNWGVADYANSVEKYLEVTIQRERAKQGCNYEVYHKLLKRCQKVLPGFSGLAFTMLDYDRMVGIAYTLARHKGYKNIAKTFRALLGRASKDRDVMFKLSQLGDFCFSDYNPDKYVMESTHPDVLSMTQLKAFLNMNMEFATPDYKDRQQVQLYHDFCVFMFHSFLAPCDVIKAKLKDISNKKTLMIRRKKTHRAVEIPLSPAMLEIIYRYKGQSKDGYIFPIMDDDFENSRITKDYTFKKFRGKLNIWLKSVGKELEVNDYELYAYVFRHTAITVAIDSGLPVSYVANVAGTSVEMIQKHYYNGDNVSNNARLMSVFQSAAI